MKQARARLTKEPNVDKALIGIKAFRQDVKLLDQLFTLGTILLEFISYARHEIDEHSRDSYESEDIVKWGDKLRLDYFDNDIINEAFQSNL